MMDKYIEKCEELSLTAKLAIALISFENFCLRNNLQSGVFGELSEYLWKWPLINGPDEFNPWEQSRPELVNFGLGDAASGVLLESLKVANVEESQFRYIIEGMVEILWGNFWGASQNGLAMKSLRCTLSSSKPQTLPPLTPFKFSQFKDGDGWGNPISEEDRDFWRYSCNLVKNHNQP